MGNHCFRSILLLKTPKSPMKELLLLAHFKDETPEPQRGRVTPIELGSEPEHSRTLIFNHYTTTPS